MGLPSAFQAKAFSAMPLLLLAVLLIVVGTLAGSGVIAGLGWFFLGLFGVIILGVIGLILLVMLSSR